MGLSKDSFEFKGTRKSAAWEAADRGDLSCQGTLPCLYNTKRDFHKNHVPNSPRCAVLTLGEVKKKLYIFFYLLICLFVCWEWGARHSVSRPIFKMFGLLHNNNIARHIPFNLAVLTDDWVDCYQDMRLESYTSFWLALLSRSLVSRKSWGRCQILSAKF